MPFRDSGNDLWRMKRGGMSDLPRLYKIEYSFSSKDCLRAGKRNMTKIRFRVDTCSCCTTGTKAEFLTLL